MKFIKQLPNALTLLNLFSGLIAVYFAVLDELVIAALFVFLGVFFDFFDGFAARILKVEGALGKQLDSLADMVTSGVVPGLVLFQLLQDAVLENSWLPVTITLSSANWQSYFTNEFFIGLIGFIFSLGAAYRLANFNIDERQTGTFIGLPTPAATLVVLSLPLILEFGSNETVHVLIQNSWVLIGLTLLLCVMMNSNIALFALKFKEFSWRKNAVKYIYLMFVVLLSVFMKFAAIPLAILAYVLFSIIENKRKITV